MTPLELHQEKVKQFWQITEEADKIANSDLSWEDKYNLIFPGVIKAISETGIRVDWNDPDESCEDDVLAFVNALKEHAIVLQTALNDVNTPYITRQEIVTTKHYNYLYGDDKLCKCGHPYYRHFDTYENMLAVGCKYCECIEFNV